jgi:hypothetical protein
MNWRLQVTSARLIALVIGIPLSLVAIGFAGLNGVAYAGQGSYPVRLNIPVHGTAVTIGLDSGDLTGYQGSGERLALRGTARYSLVRSTVLSRANASGVTVESSCHFVIGVCSFDYRVVVPAGARVTFSDGSGDITVSGLTNLDVSASDGSGNITLTFATVPDRVTVDDAFGDITVVLPRTSASYKVNAQATFGATSVAVPVSSLSPHVITVTDSSGNISIKSGP